MQVPLTAKLQLTTTYEQAEQLRRTALASRAALKDASRVACAHGTLSHAVPLQQLV
jgi:hypothetical protein